MSVSWASAPPRNVLKPHLGLNGSESLATWCLIRMLIKGCFQRNPRKGKSSSSTFHFRTKEGQESPLLSPAGWPPAVLSPAGLLPCPLPRRHRSPRACSCRNPRNPGEEDAEWVKCGDGKLLEPSHPVQHPKWVLFICLEFEPHTLGLLAYINLYGRIQLSI